MPGSIQLVSIPEGRVLPNTLSTAFREVRTWPVVATERYADGRNQQRVDGTVCRRGWTLSKRLTYSNWLALKTFFDARKGATEPFYFYPLSADFDATGSSVTGRVAVRFDGRLDSEYNMTRFNSSFSLIEVA